MNKRRNIANLFFVANAKPAAGSGIAAAANAVTLLDDGWMEVACTGSFPHPDPKVGLQKVERADLDTLLAEFEAEKAEAGANWAGLCLYIGHPTGAELATAPAYAWFKAARIAPNAAGLDSLQLKPEWTPEGDTLVNVNKSYKFTSVYWYGVKDAQNCFRPVYLGHVGLTNNPVIKGAPVANAEGINPSPDHQGGDVTQVQTPPPPVTGQWWQQLTGELQSMVAGATDANSAIAILTAKLQALYAMESQISGMRELIRKICDVTDCCCPPCCCPCDTPEQMPKFEVELVAESVMPTIIQVASSAKNAKSATADLHELLLDLAVANGAVAPAARESAKALLAANAGAAKALWFPGGMQAACNAVARPPQAPRLPQAPGNPLNGRKPAGNAAFVVGNQAGGPPLGKINDAAKAIMAARNCSYDAAHAAAWQQWEEGRL